MHSQHRFGVLIAVLALATTAHADAKKPLHSVWIGNYVCAQGSTALRLTIETREKDAASARFEFAARHSRVPSG